MPGPQNLLVSSEQFDAAAWGKAGCSITANQTTAPDGTLTGDKFTDDTSTGTHNVAQATSAASPGGYVYCFSVYAKDASGGATPWLFITVDNGGAGVVFNSATGEVGTVYLPVTSTGARLVDYGVEVANNGWFRFWVSEHSPTSYTGFSAGVFSAADSATLSYTGAGTARFYLWGAQAVRSASLQSYVTTTTAVVDDGSWLRPRALQVQNLLQQSEAIATSPWGANTHVTLTNNTIDVSDPIGGNAATKVVYDGAGTAGQYLFAQNVLPQSAYTGELGSVGIWIRAASGSFSIQLTENWSAALDTVTVDTTWRFFSRTRGALTPGITLQLALYLAVGDGAAHTLYVWGAQASRGTNQLGPYAKTVKYVVGGGPGRRLRMANVEAAQNLLLWSEAMDNGAWAVTGLGVAADAAVNPVNGLTAADKLTETAITSVHTNLQNVSTNLVQGEVYTLSAYLNGGTRRYGVVRAGTAVGYEASFDLQNGVITSKINILGASMQDLGGGWYRCWITFRAADGGTVGSQIALSNTGGAYGSYVGDTSKYLYVFGVQLTRGGLSPYVRSAATSVGPTGAVRHRALITQNLVAQSEAFDQAAAWSTFQSTVSANQVTNPVNGALDADAIVDNAVSGQHYVYSAVTTAPLSYLSASVYVKLAKSGTIPVILVGMIGAFSGGGTYFNLVTGAKQDVLAADQFSRSESLGNGWFRLSIFGRISGAPGVATQFYINPCPALGTPGYVGNGTAAAYVWGAQVTATPVPVPHVKSAALPLGAVAGMTAEAGSFRGALTMLQNLLLYSEQFDQSAWQKLGDAVVTANTATAPNGLAVADKIASAAGSGYVQQNVTPAIKARVYTASVWLRADSTINVSLQIGDSADGNPTYSKTVVVTTSWQRASISYVVTPASSASVAMIIQVLAAGYVYAWGAQVVTAPTATPYVPSTSAAVNPEALPLRAVA